MILLKGHEVDMNKGTQELDPNFLLLEITRLERDPTPVSIYSRPSNNIMTRSLKLKMYIMMRPFREWAQSKLL